MFGMWKGRKKGNSNYDTIIESSIKNRIFPVILAQRELCLDGDLYICKKSGSDATLVLRFVTILEEDIMERKYNELIIKLNAGEVISTENQAFMKVCENINYEHDEFEERFHHGVWMFLMDKISEFERNRYEKAFVRIFNDTMGEYGVATINKYNMIEIEMK